MAQKFFKDGHEKLGGRVKGSRNKKTILAEELGVKDIKDFKGKVLRNLGDFLDDKNKMIKFYATKEALKYIFSPATDKENVLTETELTKLREIIYSQMKDNV